MGDFTNTLVGAIGNAMDLAKGAYEDWNKPEVKDLKEWIFGTDPNNLTYAYNRYSEINQQIQDKETAQKRKWERSRYLFFCDLSEMEIKDNEDPTGKVTKVTTNKLLGTTTLGNATEDCDGDMLAYTDQGPPSSIVFCPKYLDKMKSQFYPTVVGAIKQILSVPPDLAELGFKITKTPMDYFSLLESTILHEMTHTAFGGYTRDVDGQDSYGWENVIRLANEGWDNAESLAFFPIGVRLIREGFGIQKDGKVTLPKPKE
ncbi:hypothetical protein F5Y13DRAFT_192269 [Hypoxylon sp. FL1857]|nr:hypothetical protein F5Y13DRAFT_192269 [Hypoxylon sp. FL1857]